MTGLDARELWAWVNGQRLAALTNVRRAQTTEVRHYHEGISEGYRAVMDHICPDVTSSLCAALASDLTRLAEDEDTPVDDVAGLRAAARLVTEWAATKAKPS